MTFLQKYFPIMLALVLCSGVRAQDQKHTHKGSIGIYYHYEGMLPSVAYEFSLTRRVSLELSAGMWQQKGNSALLSPTQSARTTKYAVSVDARYYLFLNRRNQLEGISILGHWGHFRSRVVALLDEYLGFRNFQNEYGIGISGQYFLIPRISLGLSAMVNYVWVTDYHLNPDGSIRFLGKRPGYLPMGFFQVGYRF
ncbi:MAG: hypothetical protein AAGN35_18170 [Bacteroidota bacterium]